MNCDKTNESSAEVLIPHENISRQGGVRLQLAMTAIQTNLNMRSVLVAAFHLMIRDGIENKFVVEVE